MPQWLHGCDGTFAQGANGLPGPSHRTAELPGQRSVDGLDLRVTPLQGITNRSQLLLDCLSLLLTAPEAMLCVLQLPLDCLSLLLTAPEAMLCVLQLPLGIVAAILSFCCAPEEAGAFRTVLRQFTPCAGRVTELTGDQRIPVRDSTPQGIVLLTQPHQLVDQRLAGTLYHGERTLTGRRARQQLRT